MLLISLMVAFLSPLTTLVVKSDSVPTITIFKSEFFTPLSDPHKYLKLICKATGDPTPKIHFFFHANDAAYGKPLQNLSNVVKISESEIQIKNVSSADTGTYRCVAVNKNARVFKNRKVSVDVPGEFFKDDSFNKPPTTLEVELGREKEIFCPVKKFPYPRKFTWGAQPRRKRNFYIKEDERVHITDQGNLYFSSVTKKDVQNINQVGGISCIMTYEGTPTLSRRIKFRVVKENVSHIAPSLHVKLTGTTYILQGASQQLRCIGGGNPVPFVTWFKDGEQIKNNDSSYHINPKQPGVLKITNFQPRLAGNYKCTLTNRLGTVESDGNVRLAAPPTIVRPFSEVTTAFRDNILTLKCGASGILPISYEWYKDGKALNSFRVKGRLMKVDEETLIIDPVTELTAGTYQCYAINSYGNTQSNTRVVVKAPKVVDGGKQIRESETTPSSIIVIPTPRAEKKRLDDDDDSMALQLKYIIIIACSGAVCLVLMGGGICMYCRSKENSEKVIYIPPADRGHTNVSRNDVIKTELTRTDIKQQLMLDLANLPPPPPSLTDHSDDDLSSYGGGYKNHNHPLYYNDNTMMYLLKHTKDEHLYADIPEDFRCESDTPSTEL